MKFLIWSREHHGWWKQNRWGYAYSRLEAGRFSLDEAVEICKEANSCCGDDQEPEESIVPAEDLVTEEETKKAMEMLNEN